MQWTTSRIDRGFQRKLDLDAGNFEKKNRKKWTQFNLIKMKISASDAPFLSIVLAVLILLYFFINSESQNPCLSIAVNQKKC